MIRRSLRGRLALALFAVLTPFMLSMLVGIGYLVPAMLAPMEDIITEVTEEMEPVRHLQHSLLTAAVAARDGRSGTVSAELASHINETFAQIQAVPHFDPHERTLIQSARREWDHALATYSQPTKMSPNAQARLVALRAENASSILDGVYLPARQELERSRADAQAAKTRTLWIAVAAFGLALCISVYAGARVAGPLLSDVDSLRATVSRFASGELSCRIAQPGTSELSDLAAAFNGMAERIQADQAALAELATRDGLTGLLNRREFLRLVREELDRARRYRHPFALLLLDVDHFKRINDTWGHPVGDDVLRTIAGRVTNELRPTDRVARYGGEEFSVLLPETDISGAAAVAERIRAAIAAAPVVAGSAQPVPVTASIGAAAYPHGGLDEQALISSADRNLYGAKAGGRDRVVAGLGVG